MSQGANDAAVDITSELWTVRKQAASSKVKPVKVLELGENERGKFVRVEFDDESTRPLYLETMEDVLHPLIELFDATSHWSIRDFFRSHLDEVLPNGHVKKFPSLSFQSVTKNKRGTFLASNSFDVKPKPYHDAKIDGFEMAREYLKLRKFESYPAGTRLIDMVRELAEAYDATKGLSEPSTQGYVYAFLSAMDDVIRHTAKKMDIDHYIDQRVQLAEQDRADFSESIETEKRKFVERMKKARDAKKLNEAKAKQQAACVV